MLDFYMRIDNLLKSRKATQKELCAYLGLSSVQIYSNWKQRDSIPSAETAVKIAQYLFTSVEYLVTGKQSDLGKIATNAAESNKKLADENLLLVSENRRLKENIDKAVSVLTSQN